MFITLLGCKISRKDAVALYTERRLTQLNIVDTPGGFRIDLGKGRLIEAWGTQQEVGDLRLDMLVAGLLARAREEEEHAG